MGIDPLSKYVALGKQKSDCDCYPMPCSLVETHITFVGFMPTNLIYKQNILMPIEKERITGQRMKLSAKRAS